MCDVERGDGGGGERGGGLFGHLCGEVLGPCEWVLGASRS